MDVNMYGSNELAVALNVTSIKALVDSYGTGKAIFSDILCPTDFTGEASINFYLAQSANLSLDYGDYIYLINCRDITYKKSRAIAQAVINVINRTSYTDYYLTCTLMQTISPMDDTGIDNYNTPVSVRIKTR